MPNFNRHPSGPTVAAEQRSLVGFKGCRYNRKTILATIAAQIPRMLVFGQARNKNQFRRDVPKGACPMNKLDWRAPRGRLMSVNGRFRAGIFLIILNALLFGTGCTLISQNKPIGAFLGRSDVDDYSPTAIQIGDTQQFWWCGQASNPALPSQQTDTILYASANLTTKSTSMPVVALAETPGAWDSSFTCNPKVIGGVFTNPLGDGITYTYAMYYVATTSPAGISNNIGVAFSNDGIHWKKYPQPVIVSNTTQFYGVGQPALYNSDHKSGIWIFYEDLEGPPAHYKATSTDGIHFTVEGQLTTTGLNLDLLDGTWGDMAYDSEAGYWYAVYNLARRNPSTTGGIVELGQPGIALYRIPNDSLISGATPWQMLESFDTNLTGHEANFIGGFLRDQFGNLNVGPYPTIQIYTSFSNPAPAWNATPGQAGSSGGPQNWDIGSVQWIPANTQVPLNSYSNSSSTEFTTGYIDPTAGFKLGTPLGHIYQGPQSGANVPLYGCKSGNAGYFVSTDITCGGSLLLGLNGYLYPAPQSGVSLSPLYTCNNAAATYVSKNAACQGAGASASTNSGPTSNPSAGPAAGTLLGYALP
jgi:hypothetical protein